MSLLQLRQEFQTQHMRATAIELSNRQNTGWTQGKAASELLDITYPTSDVRRALDAVAATSAGKPIVMMGQRGSGKSHIMALVHHAFGAPDQVESWASSWGEKLQAGKLINLKLQRGFIPLSETLSNQEYHTSGMCFSTGTPKVHIIAENLNNQELSSRQNRCSRICLPSRRPPLSSMSSKHGTTGFTMNQDLKEKSGDSGLLISSKPFLNLQRTGPIYSALSCRYATTQPMPSSKSIVKVQL